MRLDHTPLRNAIGALSPHTCAAFNLTHKRSQGTYRNIVQRFAKRTGKKFRCVFHHERLYIIRTDDGGN